MNQNTSLIDLNKLRSRVFIPCKGKNVAVISVFDGGGWASAVLTVKRASKGIAPTDFSTPITLAKNTSTQVVCSGADYLVVETTTVESAGAQSVYALLGWEVSE